VRNEQPLPQQTVGGTAVGGGVVREGKKDHRMRRNSRAFRSKKEKKQNVHGHVKQRVHLVRMVSTTGVRRDKERISLRERTRAEELHVVNKGLAGAELS